MRAGMMNASMSANTIYWLIKHFIVLLRREFIFVIRPSFSVVFNLLILNDNACKRLSVAKIWNISLLYTFFARNLAKTFVLHNHGYRASCIYDLGHYKRVSPNNHLNPNETRRNMLPPFAEFPRSTYGRLPLKELRDKDFILA